MTEVSMKMHHGSVSEQHTTPPTFNTNSCSSEHTFIHTDWMSQSKPSDCKIADI